MIRHLLNYLQQPFIRVTGYSALSTFVKMGAGFITMKFLALYSGLAGVAIFGQLMNATSILITFGLAGIGTGVTKYIASTESLKGKFNIIATSLRLTLFSSMLIGLSLLLFPDSFSKMILNNIGYGLVFQILGASITLACLNNWLLAVMNGFKEYRLYTLTNLASSVLIAALTVCFVYVWGSEGALIAFVLGQSAVILISIMFIKRTWLRSSFFRFGVDMGIAKQLLGYSMTALAGTVLLPLSQIIVRSLIIEEFSINDAGIWEGMTRISFVYLSVLTSSIQIYYLPRLAEIKSDNELIGEVKKTYLLVIPPLLLATVFIYVMRDVIINILFTAEFHAMRELFAWQLIGDFLKISSWLLAFVMPARGLIKALLVTEVVFNLSYVAMAYVFLHFFGLEGALMGYAANYLLYGVTVYLIVKAHVNVK